MFSVPFETGLIYKGASLALVIIQEDKPVFGDKSDLTSTISSSFGF